MSSSALLASGSVEYIGSMSRTELREASIRVDTMHYTLVLGSLQHYHPSHKPQKVMRCIVAQLLPKVAPGMFVCSEKLS